MAAERRHVVGDGLDRLGCGGPDRLAQLGHADATVLRTGRDAAPQVPVCWIAWGERRFSLSPGEHVIGRDPDVDVRLDAATVSRRHARLVVTAEGAAIEDLGSKNGTFRAGEPVTSPVALFDGDSIGIGSLVVTFHARGDDTTETVGWVRGPEA